MIRNGTVHVVWANRSATRQDPKFFVMFADYQSPGGAMARKEISGEFQLRDFLLSKVAIRADAVDAAIPALYGEGNVSFLDIALSDGKLAELGFISKDHPAFQRERIRQLAAEVAPECEVVFDSHKPFSWIKFRLDIRGAGTIAGVSGDYHASEIADWSDDHLRNYIRSVAPYFTR